MFILESLIPELAKSRLIQVLARLVAFAGFNQLLLADWVLLAD